MDKYTIIKLKEEGMSNRQIAKQTGIDRKTVAKIWRMYVEDIKKLYDSKSKLEEIQERIVSKPTYNASKRLPRKYNDDIDKFIDEILSKKRVK